MCLKRFLNLNRFIGIFLFAYVLVFCGNVLETVFKPQLFRQWFCWLVFLYKKTR